MHLSISIEHATTKSKVWTLAADNDVSVYVRQYNKCIGTNVGSGGGCVCMGVGRIQICSSILL